MEIILKTFQTSSPCSQCIYLRDMRCTKDGDKECHQEPGDKKGWRSTEYVEKNDRRIIGRLGFICYTD